MLHRLLLAAALAVGLSSAAQAQSLTAGKVITGSPTYSNDQNVPLQLDAGGALRTTGGASAGTNRSATVATTAANLMPANTARRGWKVKNDCANAIWINFDATAAAVAGSGNIKIASGGYLVSEPSFVETGAMSAIAETSACAVTAREH